MVDRNTLTCPICLVGKNDKTNGGNEQCFHCDTCWFAECYYINDPINEPLQRIKTRLIELYKETREL